MNSQQVLLDVCEEVAQRIPIHRWERLREPITWTEHIDGEEVHFELLVFENTKDYIHVFAGIMYNPITWDDPNSIPIMANATTDIILNKVSNV